MAEGGRTVRYSRGRGPASPSWRRTTAQALSREIATTDRTSKRARTAESRQPAVQRQRSSTVAPCWRRRFGTPRPLGARLEVSALGVPAQSSRLRRAQGWKCSKTLSIRIPEPRARLHPAQSAYAGRGRSLRDGQPRRRATARDASFHPQRVVTPSEAIEAPPRGARSHTTSNPPRRTGRSTVPASRSQKGWLSGRPEGGRGASHKGTTRVLQRAADDQSTSSGQFRWQHQPCCRTNRGRTECGTSSRS
jgi:hypothetical protein